MYQEIDNDDIDRIGEINIDNTKKMFDFYETNYEYLSPYDYEKYFNKKMSFNNFSQNITYLLNYDIINDELLHFRKFYGK